MIFVKNFKVLLSLNWFEKDLDIKFNNVLNGRKAFLELANDFGQKSEISSQYFFSLKKTLTWCLKTFHMETKSF